MTKRWSVKNYTGHYTSVRIRCVQIAEILKCDYVVDVKNLDHVPHNKCVFICVKVGLMESELKELSSRGIIVWDIQYVVPPEDRIFWYLGSSTCAIQKLSGKKTHIIPQHHCNFIGRLNPFGIPQSLSWIGRPFWCPDFAGLDVQVYDSNKMCLEKVVAAYRRMGLCLNVRRKCPEAETHVQLNDGGKLINCMAFGIPSVSDREPTYEEDETNYNYLI